MYSCVLPLGFLLHYQNACICMQCYSFIRLFLHQTLLYVLPQDINEMFMRLQHSKYKHNVASCHFQSSHSKLQIKAHRNHSIVLGRTIAFWQSNLKVNSGFGQTVVWILFEQLLQTTFNDFNFCNDAKFPWVGNNNFSMVRHLNSFFLYYAHLIKGKVTTIELHIWKWIELKW